MSAELYSQLRALAGAYFRGQGAEHTLQPTALVNEAFLKLAASNTPVRERSHFLALAATAMRQILTDHARKKNADKRGGGLRRITLTGPALLADGEADVVGVLEIDALLSRLGAVSERQARIVEMRLFGGLTVTEVAEALDTSPRTVEREWRFARAWLRRHLAGD